MNWRKIIPWSLTALRAVLGPALVMVALWTPYPQAWLGAMIAAGFLSDIYDGVLARRWGTATAALRISDSVTDVVFYLCVLAAAVLRHGAVLHDRSWWLAAVLALMALHMIFDWIKFGRISSYHAYSAKVWGILLATAMVALLCFDRGFWLVTAALAWGVLCEAEGIAMSVLLPQWTHDVKTLRRALEIRRAKLKEQPVAAGR